MRAAVAPLGHAGEDRADPGPADAAAAVLVGVDHAAGRTGQGTVHAPRLGHAGAPRRARAAASTAGTSSTSTRLRALIESGFGRKLLAGLLRDARSPDRAYVSEHYRAALILTAGGRGVPHLDKFAVARRRAGRRPRPRGVAGDARRRRRGCSGARARTIRSTSSTSPSPTAASRASAGTCSGTASIASTRSRAAVEHCRGAPGHAERTSHDDRAWTTPPTLRGRHVRAGAAARRACRRPARGGAGRRVVATLVHQRARRRRRSTAYIAAALAMQASGTAARVRRPRCAPATIVGTHALLRPRHADVPRLSIGYTWYAQRVQRTGLNTEAKLLLLGHAFDALGCVAVALRDQLVQPCARAPRSRAWREAGRRAAQPPCATPTAAARHRGVLDHRRRMAGGEVEPAAQAGGAWVKRHRHRRRARPRRRRADPAGRRRIRDFELAFVVLARARRAARRRARAGRTTASCATARRRVDDAAGAGRRCGRAGAAERQGRRRASPRSTTVARRHR